MYWIFFILFSIGILVPDIVRNSIYFLSEERAEEATLLLLGATGFLIFLFKEKELLSEKKEKEKNKKKLDETGKDLIESYSYIGEVNRKIDMLIGVMLNLSKGKIANKKKEEEAYFTITDAARAILRGENATLLFYNVKENQIEELANIGSPRYGADKKILRTMGGVINIKKNKNYIIISSPHKIGDVRSYIKVEGYSEEEEKRPKNGEILKMLVSQALFAYSFSKIFKVNKGNKLIG